MKDDPPVPKGITALPIPLLAGLFFWSCGESGCRPCPAAANCAQPTISSLHMGMMGFCIAAIVILFIWTLWRLGAFD